MLAGCGSSPAWLTAVSSLGSICPRVFCCWSCMIGPSCDYRMIMPGAKRNLNAISGDACADSSGIRAHAEEENAYDVATCRSILRTRQRRPTPRAFQLLQLTLARL